MAPDHHDRHGPHKGGKTESADSSGSEPIWPTAANPYRSRGNPQPSGSYAAIAARVSNAMLLSDFEVTSMLRAWGMQEGGML